MTRTSWRWIRPAAALVSVALAIAAVPHDGRSAASSLDRDRRSESGGGPPLLDWPVVSPRTLVSML